MKWSVSRSSVNNEAHFLRSAGYHFHVDPVTGHESWARQLGDLYYPRFHIYTSHGSNNSIVFDLHLDQKKASYAGTHAHAGEHDTPVVVAEMERLQSFALGALPRLHNMPDARNRPQQKKSGFFSRLFGA